MAKMIVIDRILGIEINRLHEAERSLIELALQEECISKVKECIGILRVIPEVFNASVDDLIKEV